MRESCPVDFVPCCFLLVSFLRVRIDSVSVLALVVTFDAERKGITTEFFALESSAYGFTVV